MKAAIIYDSAYGNTERIAQTIGEELGSPAKAVRDVKPSELEGLDLLVVGSPTQGGRPTVPIQEFLKQIPTGSLKDVRVAAFDTRFEKETRGFPLRVLMGVIGFAAPKIAASLKQSGAMLAAEPEGFIVTGKEGPLKEGELARAKTWAKGLSSEP